MIRRQPARHVCRILMLRPPQAGRLAARALRWAILLIVGAPIAVAAATSAITGTPTSRDAEIDALVAQMTVDEKVGQMIQAEQDKLENIRDIETYHLGSLLSGGDSDAAPGNSLAAWRDLYERCQRVALGTRLKIPILYGIDAVHGHNNVAGAVIFPHNIGLGATRSAALVEEIARATAREVRATGIQWTFAPCIAVARDERWGRTYESFSEDPQLVAELGAAAVKGLQGKDPSDPARVLACAKHYVGDGGTAWGTGRPDDSQPRGRYPLDRGDTRLAEEDLRRLHLPGYVTAIDAGVLSIMPSYSSWNGRKLSGDRHLLTDVLKGELGFAGFLISDYNAIEELPGSYRDQIRESVSAGMDMLMVPGRYREAFEGLRDLTAQGEIPMARIDDAVRRILRVKRALGLLDRSPLADRQLEASFGSAEHHALARRAVRASLVLLKNDRQTLPLRKGLRRLHVAGARADDLGSQCGGWTITWQGATGPVTGGTTILEAIRKAVSPTTEVTFSADGTAASGAEAVVAVIGETPYAEFRGDREDLSLPTEDLQLLKRLRQAKVPVAVVLLSGRPLVLGEALADMDALVAAWLPGTEGSGVADVLFGDSAPTGKLPTSWPRSMAQIPINVGDTRYDPLFPYGHGLTYPERKPQASEPSAHRSDEH